MQLERLGLLLLVVVAPATYAAACSGAGDSPADRRNDAGPDMRLDVRDVLAGPERDVDPPRHPGVPSTWVRFDGVSKLCGHYLPPSEADFPPPMRWIPCTGDAGAFCSRLASEPNQTNSAWHHGTRLPAGEVILAFQRDEGELHYGIIAESDGPVRQAILTTDYIHCPTGMHRVFRNRYVYQVQEGFKSTGGAILAGELGAIAPRLVVELDDALRHDFWPASFGMLDLATAHSYRAHAWANGVFAGEIAASGGYTNTGPTLFDGGFFWSPGNRRDDDKIRVYTPETGARDFLRSGDPAVGDADIGTDGVDLVWIRASGRTKPGPFFASFDIMTAAFTTDPTALAPRRVRSEEGPSFAVRKFTVGCGYAARSNGIHVRIVKLTTGESWTFPSNDGWGEPLVMTCDELFLSGWFDGGSTIARIRLDSLGPPIPPD